jgi:mannitol/fructose-specific phosphotransferase system IIA component (Ntr-type)
VVLLSGTTKAEALGQLIDRLAQGGVGVSGEALSQAVWKREALMSTGVGQGIAVPHVRMPGVPRTTMAVGVSRRGIADYESLDGKPVHIIVLIAATEGDHEGYIRLLASTTDVLKQQELRESVVEAEKPEDIFRVLTEGQA